MITGVEITTGIDEKYIDKSLVPVGVKETKSKERNITLGPIQTITHEVYSEKIIFGNKKEARQSRRRNRWVKLAQGGGTYDRRRKIKRNIHE